MEEKTLFPREEKSEILFKKISEDKWACEKLMETFCSYLFSNDGVDLPDSPSSTEFAQVLFNSYRNRDLSASLMAICQNTVFEKCIPDSLSVQCGRKTESDDHDR